MSVSSVQIGGKYSLSNKPVRVAAVEAGTVYCKVEGREATVRVGADQFRRDANPR